MEFLALIIKPKLILAFKISSSKHKFKLKFGISASTSVLFDKSQKFLWAFYTANFKIYQAKSTRQIKFTSRLRKVRPILANLKFI